MCIMNIRPQLEQDPSPGFTKKQRCRRARIISRMARRVETMSYQQVPSDNFPPPPSICSRCRSSSVCFLESMARFTPKWLMVFPSPIGTDADRGRASLVPGERESIRKFTYK